MLVKREKSDNGGRTYHIDHPTFTESLLMEILLQLIPGETADETIRAIALRAGFTGNEIKERIG